MHFPHERFIRALIASRAVGPVFDRTLLEYGLLRPGRTDLLRIELEVMHSAPQKLGQVLANPKRKLGKPLKHMYLRLLQKIDVWEFFVGGPEWDAAANLARHHHAALLVNGLLLMGMPQPEVAEVLTKQLQYLVPGRTLELYRRYFFDLSAMPVTSWPEYYNMLPIRDAAFLRAVHDFPNDMTMVRWKAGLPVSDGDFGGAVEMCRKIMVESFARLLEHLRKGLEVNDKVMLAANLFFKAADRVIKYGREDEGTAAQALVQQLQRVTREAALEAGWLTMGRLPDIARLQLPPPVDAANPDIEMPTPKGGADEKGPGTPTA